MRLEDVTGGAVQIPRDPAALLLPKTQREEAGEDNTEWAWMAARSLAQPNWPRVFPSL